MANTPLTLLGKLWTGAKWTGVAAVGSQALDRNNPIREAGAAVIDTVVEVGKEVIPAASKAVVNTVREATNNPSSPEGAGNSTDPKEQGAIRNFLSLIKEKPLMGLLIGLGVMLLGPKLLGMMGMGKFAGFLGGPLAKGLGVTIMGASLACMFGQGDAIDNLAAKFGLGDETPPAAQVNAPAPANQPAVPSPAPNAPAAPTLPEQQQQAETHQQNVAATKAATAARQEAATTPLATPSVAERAAANTLARKGITLRVDNSDKPTAPSTETTNPREAGTQPTGPARTGG